MSENATTSAPGTRATSRRQIAQTAGHAGRRGRILDAAVEEFAAKGYAGTRTAEIARRAGVSSQLITYYFGGKSGLLRALRERWQERAAETTAAQTSFVESVVSHAEAALDNPSWARLLAWQALEGRPGGDAEGDGQEEQMRESLRRTRRRQRAGELRDDIDAELILVIAYALALAPVLLPTVTETVTGEGAPWTDYRRRLATQLPTLLGARS